MPKAVHAFGWSEASSLSHKHLLNPNRWTLKHFNENNRGCSLFQNTHSIFFLSNKTPALIEVVLYLGKDYLQTYLVARYNHVIKYNEREADITSEDYNKVL